MTHKHLPTPREMLAYCDRFVSGQPAAKRALVQAAYLHFFHVDLPAAPEMPRMPQHCLFIGPTGSGKTLLVETLSRFLGVPMLYCSCPSLSAEGYVGESVGDMLARYEELCVNTAKGDQRGILFLDEFDKVVANEEAGRGLDIRGSMIQQELLGLLDGRRLQRSKDSSHTPPYSIDASKILVVAAGVFEGLDRVVRRRVGGIGFAGSSSQKGSKGSTPEITSEDIEEYGFLSELVARFGSLTSFQPLGLSDFKNIVSQVTQSPISPYRRIVAAHGSVLRFDESALTHLAERAATCKQGGRSLRGLVTAALDDLCLELPELRDQGVSEVVVTVDSADERRLVVKRIKKVEGIRCPMPGAHPGPQGDGEEESLQERERPFDDPERVTFSEIAAEASPSSYSQKGDRGDNREDLSEKLTRRLAEVKELLRWSDCGTRGRIAWLYFEQSHEERLPQLVSFAEELLRKGETIDSSMEICRFSQTKDLRANISYVEFRRAKAAWDEFSVKNKEISLGNGELSAPNIRAQSLMSFPVSSRPEGCIWQSLVDALERRGLSSEPAMSRFQDHALFNGSLIADLAVRSQTLSPEGILAYHYYLHYRESEWRAAVGQVNGAGGSTWEKSRYHECGSPMQTDGAWVGDLCRLVAERSFLSTIWGGEGGADNTTVPDTIIGRLAELEQKIKATRLQSGVLERGWASKEFSSRISEACRGGEWGSPYWGERSGLPFFETILDLFGEELSASLAEGTQEEFERFCVQIDDAFRAAGSVPRVAEVIVERYPELLDIAATALAFDSCLLANISQTTNWSPHQLIDRYAVMLNAIGWNSFQGKAHKWWVAFERENLNRITLVFRLSQELAIRYGTITDFFLAYVYSDTDNIQANLHYLDFTRHKKVWEEITDRKGTPVSGDPGDGVTSLNTERSMFQHEPTSPAAEALWHLLVGEIRNRGISVSDVARSFVEAGIDDLELLLDVVIRANSLAPDAIISYHRYLMYREQQSAQSLSASNDKSQSLCPDWRRTRAGGPIKGGNSWAGDLCRVAAERYFWRSTLLEAEELPGTISREGLESHCECLTRRIAEIAHESGILAKSWSAAEFAENLAEESKGALLYAGQVPEKSFTPALLELFGAELHDSFLVGDRDTFQGFCGRVSRSLKYLVDWVQIAKGIVERYPDLRSIFDEVVAPDYRSNEHRIE